MKNEGASSFRAIPSSQLLSNHSEDLKALIKSIARKENISIKDAAIAVSNVLKNVADIKDMNNE